MMRALEVHLLPMLVEPAALDGGVAVVIDVLRASTTIVHALAAGARAVVPFDEVQNARQFAANSPAGTVLLGGERNGVLIDGFDLDNSPLAYTSERVTGKTVALTTTNGTRALSRCRQAQRIFVGSFVNLDAIVAALILVDWPIHVVCAGTDGRISLDDVLCAGAIATGVRAAEGPTRSTGDETGMAIDLYRTHGISDPTLLSAVRGSAGGRNLQALGFDDDIVRSATRNLFDVVPEYLPASGKIDKMLNHQGTKTPRRECD